MIKMNKKPLGIYLHIPFCVRKCLYCDFLSAPADAETIESYVNLLLREIRAASDNGQLQDYEAATVFFGGGTPSLLSSIQIDRILCKLKDMLAVRADAEITMEMNPGTVTKEKLADIRSMGVNRVSIGVQSLQDNELAALGRIHRASEVYRLWEWTEQLGFCSRSLDLMSGIPGQTTESLCDTLERAAALAPEHISAYSLIVEEGTPFHEMYPDGAVDEETDRQLYAKTKEVLKGHGYERYEISNYAKEGYACRHNLTYWMRGEYLGFGIGAASLMNEVRFRNADTMAAYERDVSAREIRAAAQVCPTSAAETAHGHRADAADTAATSAAETAHGHRADAADTATTSAEETAHGHRGDAADTAATFAAETAHGHRADHAGAGVRQTGGDLSCVYAEWEPLTVEDRMAETMFLGLRLTGGVSEQVFYGQFGRSVYEVYGSVLEKHIKSGLLVKKDGFLRLTERGGDISNYVMADFLL